ncbi:MAG: adenosine kinase [Rickettsiales bacterium]|nr:adenosine kinase [Rickettsiales bacterium]
MTNILYDVAGIGNAIVDVLSFCDDAFLQTNALAKGSMQLVDATRSAELYAKVGPSTECSGGSVANSLAGLASLGARTAFIGKVADDKLGQIFTHDMRSTGTYFTTSMLKGELPSANCIVLVTPDAQRTMATFLGACSQVTQADIDEELIKQSAIVYIEGYLWDTEHAKSAIRKAMALAKMHQRKVAMTLSDTFCVHRHRSEFLQLIHHEIDILFANEGEIKALYETEDFDTAIAKLQGQCEVAAVTRSEVGSVVVTKKEVIAVPTKAVAKVVDTTGAGDLYASGFLFGYSRGDALEQCAQLGNACAGEIIQHLGARSMKPLKALVA